MDDGPRRTIRLRFVLHMDRTVASPFRSTSRSTWAMTFLKRLRVLPAVLGVAAALTAIGTSLFGDVRPGQTPPADPTRPDGNRLVEELAVTKFSKLPTLTYQLRDGEVLFAWQVKPDSGSHARPPARRSRAGGHLGQPGRAAAPTGPPDHHRADLDPHRGRPRERLDAQHSRGHPAHHQGLRAR